MNANPAKQGFYSEDLQHEQVFEGGLQIINPFTE